MNPTLSPSITPANVPPKNCFGIPAPQLYNLALKDLKNGAIENDFKLAICQMIDIIDPKNVKYDENIVAFVMETVEHVITARKSGKQKEKIVVDILVKYFNDDEVLIQKFIKLMMPRISKSNIFRRNRNRIYNFFFGPAKK